MSSATTYERLVNPLLWGARIIVGVLFIISGFVKANDISGFAYKLDEYWEVFHLPFLSFSSFFLAWFLSVLEIALGFAVLVGYRMKVVSWVLLLMIAFFTLLTGFSAITGAVTDCGCFGEALKLTPFQSFMKDVVLMVIVTFIWLNRKRVQPIIEGVTPAAITLATFIGFGYFSYYSYRHLPAIDFIKAYKVGENLEVNMNTFDEDKGNMVAHDFFDFCTSCNENGFQGTTLYIVIYNMEKASDDAIKQSVDLYNSLSEKMPDLKVCGGTNTPSKKRKELIKEHNITYCIGGQDEKMLKTMLRSSPGYLLMKDGVILEKWHYNDTPKVNEIQDLVK